jgi:hypothetical protein
VAIELGRFLRPRPLAAAALIVVTAFGASVQMGLLVPHFGHPLTGLGSFGQSNMAAYETTLSNESWRSWTVTSIRLANGKSIQGLPDGSLVQFAGVERGQPDLGQAPNYQRFPLSVGPDQQFTIALVASCPNVASSERLQYTQYSLPVRIDVSTPLGTRSITTDFDINDGCPHS